MINKRVNVTRHDVIETDDGYSMYFILGSESMRKCTPGLLSVKKHDYVFYSDLELPLLSVDYDHVITVIHNADYDSKEMLLLGKHYTVVDNKVILESIPGLYEPIDTITIHCQGVKKTKKWWNKLFTMKK